jgi:hypothetical protein
MVNSSAIQIDCNFPGGNIIVDKIEGDTVWLKQDIRDTEGFWFYWYFRISGAGGRSLTFNFTGGKPVIGVRGPAISLDDGLTWRWLGRTNCTDDSFKYVFGPEENSVRFSFGMPYTEAELKSFLKCFASNPHLKVEKLCWSRKGRAVEMILIGKSNNPAFRAAITCRHHACEMMASYTVEGLIEAILAETPAGKWLRENVEFLIIPFVDKDGVEDGDQGKNRRPRDHNRDYDETPLYPETASIMKLLPEWGAERLIAVMDLHCPWVCGEWHEHIYQVGVPDAVKWQEQERFGKILEKCISGLLPYQVDKDLPFGKSFNVPSNYRGRSFARWAVTIPGIKLVTSFEIPYSNASGKEVNPVSARIFGHDLAHAIYLYLSSRF